MKPRIARCWRIFAEEDVVFSVLLNPGKYALSDWKKVGLIRQVGFPFVHSIEGVNLSIREVSGFKAYVCIDMNLYVMYIDRVFGEP